MPERQRTRDLIQEMAGRVAGLIRQLPSTSIPVPRSEWSVGDHAAHLAYTKDLMARWVAGESIPYSDGTREGLAAANLEALTGFSERDGAVLAGLITDAVDAFCWHASTSPAGTRIVGPLGPMPVEIFEAYCLTHLMQHGETIAMALERPSILDRPSIAAGSPFMFFALERFADPAVVDDLEAVYDVQMRGGPRVWVVYSGGRCQVTQDRPDRVDCHISADPVAFFKVGIRLIRQWGPIARGQLLAWGRRPWLALRFASTFRPP